MAVVVRYVVVRNGKEVMTFTSKKEADAHDKMLEIAEGLYEFLHRAELEIAENALDELSFFIAKNRDEFAKLLKGSKPAVPQAANVATTAKESRESRESSSEKPAEKAAKRTKSKAAEAA